MNTDQISSVFESFYRNMTINFREVVNIISRPYKLTYEQYILLKQIKKEGSVTGSVLAVLSDISRAAVSRRCRELADLGYINRLSDFEPDYRVTKFSVSKEGGDVIKQLTIDYNNRFRGIAEEFGKESFSDFALEVVKFDRLLKINLDSDKQCIEQTKIGRGKH